MKNPGIPDYKVKRFIFAVLITLPMWLLTFVILTRLNFTDSLMSAAKLSVYIYANVLFFLMVYTGKTDKYRAVFFVSVAICFPVSFISTLYATRGDFMVLSNEQLVSCGVPFCHIVIPQTLIPVILNREVIFPGAFTGFHYTIPSMFIIWIAGTLALGRGWCSWACFFGGWEDGCSRCSKKARIKKLPQKLSLLPFAILLVLVLLCAATLSPQYCWWLCPFKGVSEFVEITNLRVVIQTIIFVLLFIGLVIVLPILTKKRTQCSFLCPFGAMQSFTNKISPVEVRIDKDKCINCKKCIAECQFFALDGTALEKGASKMTCTKCGKCMDICQKGAINYHIKGTSFRSQSKLPRYIFIYTAFIILAAFGSGFIIDTIYKVLKLLTTGSMF